MAPVMVCPDTFELIQKTMQTERTSNRREPNLSESDDGRFWAKTNMAVSFAEGLGLRTEVGACKRLFQFRPPLSNDLGDFSDRSSVRFEKRPTDRITLWNSPSALW